MAGTSEGAKKAWRTIRTNRRKRSLAAKKANEFRGEDGRRAAALKAWETRRNAQHKSVKIPAKTKTSK